MIFRDIVLATWQRGTGNRHDTLFSMPLSGDFPSFIGEQVGKLYLLSLRIRQKTAKRVASIYQNADNMSTKHEER